MGKHNLESKQRAAVLNREKQLALNAKLKAIHQQVSTNTMMAMPGTTLKRPKVRIGK